MRTATGSGAPAPVAFSSPDDPPGPWREVLAKEGLELRVWPDEVPDSRGIETALVWHPPASMWSGLPDLRLIQSLGAGMEHILRTNPPPDVALARLVDPDLTGQMVEYGILGVLACHRDLHAHLLHQKARAWKPRPAVPASSRTVGVMGSGTIGTALLRALIPFGFRLRAWTRTSRVDLPGVTAFAGRDALTSFLADTDILVSVLPGTPETRELMDADRFRVLPRGAFFVNLGRGSTVCEPDLVDALRSGRLAGCVLDVFAREPLDRSSPLWHEPRALLTPHVAALTRATPHAAALLAENLSRVRGNRTPLHSADRARGY